MTTKDKVIAYNRDVKEDLQTMLASLNHGQLKNLLKNHKVKALLERYHISIEE